jgi:uncharacterized coiled-coil protein SlyX
MNTEQVAREIENIIATLLENEIDEKLPELSNQVLYSDKLLHKIKQILDQHWGDGEVEKLKEQVKLLTYKLLEKEK